MILRYLMPRSTVHFAAIKSAFHGINQALVWFDIIPNVPSLQNSWWRPSNGTRVSWGKHSVWWITSFDTFSHDNELVRYQFCSHVLGNLEGIVHVEPSNHANGNIITPKIFSNDNHGNVVNDNKLSINAAKPTKAITVATIITATNPAPWIESPRTQRMAGVVSYHYPTSLRGSILRLHFRLQALRPIQNRCHHNCAQNVNGIAVNTYWPGIIPTYEPTIAAVTVLIDIMATVKLQRHSFICCNCGLETAKTSVVPKNIISTEEWLKLCWPVKMISHGQPM